MLGLQQILGGNKGGGILGETKEAVIGGCWGLLMSGAFFFFFYLAVFALFLGISDQNFQLKLNASTSPLILALCASGFLSPFIGVMFGLQGGRYSAVRHVGCFVIYLVVLLAGFAALTFTM